MINARRYGGTVNFTADELRQNAEMISQNQTDYVNEYGEIDQEAYEQAMEQRDQMLSQADYMDQGGQLTKLERAEAAMQNGGIRPAVRI